MTTDDHATHRLSTRIRALHDIVGSPREGLIDALAFEAENLQRRLDEANARITSLLEDDRTEAEARAQVRAPVSKVMPRHGNGQVYTHG